VRLAVVWLILVAWTAPVVADGTPLTPQPPPQVSGVAGIVRDADSGDPVPGVIVEAVGTNASAISEADGSFRISGLGAGKQVLRITGSGYKSKQVVFEVVEGSTKDLGAIALEPLDTIGEEVIVVTPGTFSLMRTHGASNLTMKGDDLKNMSWAEDVTRAVARLPGISSSDYSSKFTIRGGDADEVLFTLDGMELYEPFHQKDFAGGLFSVVDIEALDGVELNTGGFSAEHGNRLSGMLQMYTKDPGDDHRGHVVAGLSLTNARGYADGEFAHGKGFYLLSVRRGVIEALFRAVGATESLPTYYDAFGKVSYKVSHDHKLSLHALYAGDSTRIRDIKLTVFLHIINLYNHANLRKFDLDTTDDNGNPSIDAQGNYVPVRDDAYWLGILPVIGAIYEVAL